MTRDTMRLQPIQGPVFLPCVPGGPCSNEATILCRGRTGRRLLEADSVGFQQKARREESGQATAEQGCGEQLQLDEKMSSD